MVLHCAKGAWTSIQPAKYVPSLNRSARPISVVPNPSDVTVREVGDFIGPDSLLGGLVTIISLVLVDQGVGMSTSPGVSLSAANTSATTLETPTTAQQRFWNDYNQL